MRVSYLFSFLLLLIIADGCVDEIRIKAPDVSFQLAVDGVITDEEGPYSVSIFKVSNLDADLDKRIPILSARVTISDDVGNSELLKETSSGIYQTSVGGLQGTVGRTYVLKIITLNGKMYESSAEKLNPAGAINNLSYEFDFRERIKVDGTVVGADGFNIYMDANSLPTGENLYRWKWTGTYEIETFPHLKTRNVEGVQVPDPLPCSGYQERDGILFQSSPCSCCSCWVTMLQGTPIVSDDQFISGNKFDHVNVAFIPVTRRTFYYQRFYLTVQQMSLSRAAFNFWRVIQSQKEGASSLFQPPSGKVRGNIFSKDGDEEVQGIFYASSVQEKSIFIEKSDVPYTVQKIDTVRTSCMFVGISTNVRPSFWK
ncbi:MAG: DUF4249 domain-containing protein [Bacteroidia bacterium]|nr:DUF4249 domain-containing protein [Bacteroidia bacterium]